ncbi:MAG: MFS transporter [Pseudomonadota bacterium]
MPDRALNEFKQGWPAALGGFVGTFFSVGTLVIYSFGLFAPELAKEFGWSRGELSFALTVFNYSIIVAGIIFGFLIDRHGPRVVVLASTLLFALAYGSLSLATESKALFYALFALMAFAGGGTLPVSYSRFIISWFDRQRGLALGLTLVGTGVGAAILPPILQAIISAYDWRTAVLVLAAGIGLISLPLSFVLLKTRPNAKAAAKSSGLVLNRAFWVLVVFSILSGMFLIGSIIHFVSILQDRGVAPDRAALFASVIGISVIVGRIGVGFLLDRLFAPRVVFFLFLGPVAAFLILRAGSSEAAFFFAALAFGLAQGAEIDIIAYLSSRYFPKEAYGATYGLLFSAFTVGAANGPLMLGLLYDRDGDYAFALLLLAAIASTAALLTFLLPRFEVQHAVSPGIDH